GLLVALSLPAFQKAFSAAEDTDLRNELKQIALAYGNVATAKSRGPTNQQELSPYYENSGRINEAISSQQLTVIWGISANGLGSKTVVAYETQADRIGIRMVAMGDASVQTMDRQEFRAALK